MSLLLLPQNKSTFQVRAKVTKQLGYVGNNNWTRPAGTLSRRIGLRVFQGLGSLFLGLLRPASPWSRPQYKAAKTSTIWESSSIVESAAVVYTVHYYREGGVQRILDLGERVLELNIYLPKYKLYPVQTSKNQFCLVWINSDSVYELAT